MKVVLIAAIGKNRELGKNNKLIWPIKDDLFRFSQETKGHTVIVGRKTLESIPKGLPGRTVIAVSREPKIKNADHTFKSVEQAITYARAKNIGKGFKDKLFIIGGAQVYADAMKFADELDLTIIDAEEPGADTFFPVYEDLFYCRQQINMQEGDLAYKFTRWVKKDRS